MKKLIDTTCDSLKYQNKKMLTTVICLALFSSMQIHANQYDFKTYEPSEKQHIYKTSNKASHQNKTPTIFGRWQCVTEFEENWISGKDNRVMNIQADGSVNSDAKFKIKIPLVGTIKARQIESGQMQQDNDLLIYKIKSGTVKSNKLQETLNEELQESIKKGEITRFKVVDLTATQLTFYDASDEEKTQTHCKR